MKLALMQPYLFPYIGYFQLINAADKFVLYDDVAFIKQGWINRNNILLNGNKHLFTVPVKSVSSNALINETLIAEMPLQWDKKLLSTFRSAYSKAPYFDAVYPMIESVFRNYVGLPISILAKNSIEVVAHYLNIDSVISLSSENGYANRQLKAQERVIDICKKENASVYFNVAGGVDLYDTETFGASGIQLCFLKANPIEYPQMNTSFVPWLSIIDVLMFNSPQETSGFLNSYSVL